MIITTRNDIGNLFNTVFKKGVGVEIGVQNGYNLKQICSQWKGRVLGVDMWPDESNYETAYEVLTGCDHVLIKGHSVIVADIIDDESLDWIYIDAGHSYEEVKADYYAWSPKVRIGGIISFHDYGVNDCIGVKTFIDELMKDNPDMKVNFTTDDFWNDMEYQTAWFYKSILHFSV